MSTVIDTVVHNGFCSGCGVCAGVCPQHVLEMAWNQYGEYNPVRINDCNPECGRCMKVCPFVDSNPNEDEIGKQNYASVPKIQHRSEIGYYLSVSCGAVTSESHRLHSVSGGLATWFLQKLLSENIVDAVICVQHSKEKGRLFEFIVARTAEDVYASAGSAYYPVEISEILRYVRDTPGKYAVIGVPCLMKGLRNAQAHSSLLRERLVMLIGLACANQKSTFFTQYAAWKAGVEEEVTSVSFRRKNPESKLAKFFTFTFEDTTGKTYLQKWDGELSAMYQNKCFTLHSCDCCDDTFAECADVCFMDAWLPKYIFEPRGMSAWISRSEDVEGILQKGIAEAEIFSEAVSLDDLISGQAAARWKREILSYRLHLLSERGEIIPKKRVSASEGSGLSYLEREKCKRALVLQREGRICAAECVAQGDGFTGVHKWFEGVWGKKSVGIRVGEFVRGKMDLVKMGVKYLCSRIHTS